MSGTLAIRREAASTDGVGVLSFHHDEQRDMAIGDAIMKPTRIAELVAERMWRDRDQIRRPVLREAGEYVDLATQGHDLPDVEYDARVVLPGEIVIEIRNVHEPINLIMAGHSTRLERFDAYRIRRTWRAVQAAAILETMDPGVDLDAVRVRRGGDLFERITRPLGDLLGYVPARWPGQNVAEELDDRIAGEISHGRYERREGTRPWVGFDGQTGTRRVIWHQMRDGVSFLVGSELSLEGEVGYLMASHPDHGHVRLDGVRSLRAFKRRQSMAFSSTLTGGTARTIHLPQTGNARIARIARICRDAVTVDPDLRDARGTPLLPLVQTHLPDLLRRHAAAARNAPAESLGTIDADLDKGVGIIRRAIEEGMAISTDARIGELRDQLRFLETRHPDASDGI